MPLTQADFEAIRRQLQERCSCDLDQDTIYLAEARLAAELDGSTPSPLGQPQQAGAVQCLSVADQPRP